MLDNLAVACGDAANTLGSKIPAHTVAWDVFDGPNVRIAQSRLREPRPLRVFAGLASFSSLPE